MAEDGALKDASPQEHAGDSSQAPARIGRFEIIERIGQGGMGTVFKARQVSMDRIVALKVLPPKLAQNKSFVQRFIREARSAARLNHPNIVQGIDVGQAEGHYYFAMEFVDGTTVKEMIKAKGRLDEKTALNIVGAVARGLEHAAKHGIIHRDVKPDNIMVARDGAVKLADLGLARSTEKPDTMTIEGTALGTPYYMAPEQVRGETGVDTRADIYALGATLFHMVTGEFTYTGPNAGAIMARHLSDPIPSAREKHPDVSRATDELIRPMLSKDPADRPQTPTELIQEIRDALAGKVHLRAKPVVRSAAGRQQPVGGASLRRETATLRKTTWVAVAAVAAIAIGVAAFLALRPSRKVGDVASIVRPTTSSPTKPSTPSSVVPPSKHPTKADDGLQRDLAAFRATVADLAAKDQFAEALEQADVLAIKHPGAAVEVDKVRKGVIAIAERRYDELSRSADAAIEAKDFAKARDALKPIASFGIVELTERAKKRIAEIASREKGAAAWAKWDETRSAAAKLIASGKLDDAAKLLDSAKGLPLDGIADLIAEQTKSVEAAKRRATEAALAAYQAESDKVWALFKKRDYAQADKLLAALTADARFQIEGGVSTPSGKAPNVGGAPAPCDLLAADQEALGLLKEFWTAVERGVMARKGKFVSIAGKGGNVESVENGQVTLKVGAKVFTASLLAMDSAQAAAVAALKDDERSNLARAIFFLGEGEKLDEASRLLAAAGRPKGLAYYKNRLAGLTLGAAEIAAHRAWEEIDALARDKLTKAQTARLGQLLDRFEVEHAQSGAGNQVAGRIAALRARIGKAAEPIVYTEWPFDEAEAKRRQRATARALDVKTELDIDLGKGVRMIFVLIPAGEFLMGSPPATSPEKLATAYGGDSRGYEREFPQHRVRISRPFWMCKYPVTQEQWMAVLGTNPSRFKDKPKNPVEQVDWTQAQGFGRALSEKLGKPFRLPTEAEWEYACRAGTATEFYFGNDAAKAADYGWVGIDSTAPVGAKKPNTWGLHDMGGNVWEWCADYYGAYGAGDQTDPAGVPTGSARVLRGGYYHFLPSTRRSACRSGIDPGARLGHVGFRVVLAAGAQEVPEAAADGGKARQRDASQ